MEKNEEMVPPFLAMNIHENLERCYDQQKRSCVGI
jgi:hypothetical protein